MNSVASNLFLAEPLFEKIDNILHLTEFCGVFVSSSHFQNMLVLNHWELLD